MVRSLRSGWLADAQRIMGVKYSFPSNLALSKECLDLISKIFVGNPSARITLAGVKQHPWFLKNLPDELTVRHHVCSSLDIRAGALCSPMQE